MGICSICRESREVTVSAHLKIAHKFCKDCLLNWIVVSGDLNCPLCQCIIDNCWEIFDDKNELLYFLSGRKDGYDLLKKLLEAEIDLGFTEEYYISLLEMVVNDNSIALTKLLLERHEISQNLCVDTRDRAKKLLINACAEGNSEMVELFLRHPLNFDWGYACLHAAIENSRSEIAKQLILKGVDIHVSMEGSEDDCVCKGFLDATIGKKMYDVAALLIDHGADVNTDARFHLDRLCKEGQLALLRKLIDHGCPYKPFLEETLLSAAAHDQVEILRFFHQRDDGVFCNDKILKEAIKHDSLEAVRFLCTENLSEGEIKDVWKKALSSSPSLKLLRHLASVYPFEKSLYEEEIGEALKAAHMPHLMFLRKQGMAFDEALASIEIDSENYSLDAALLISTVTDGWIDQYRDEFLPRAIHEFHRGLLEYYEARLGPCVLLDLAIRFVIRFPNERHNDYHGGTKQSIEYFLKKEYFCASLVFLNHCLRIACIESDAGLVRTLLGKGAGSVAARQP